MDFVVFCSDVVDHCSDFFLGWGCVFGSKGGVDYS